MSPEGTKYVVQLGTLVVMSERVSLIWASTTACMIITFILKSTASEKTSKIFVMQFVNKQPNGNFLLFVPRTSSSVSLRSNRQTISNASAVLRALEGTRNSIHQVGESPEWTAIGRDNEREDGRKTSDFGERDRGKGVLWQARQQVRHDTGMTDYLFTQRQTT